MRQLRIRRGEQPRGYKVSFTNRTIWERYGVYAPIWGTVWNTTLSFCEGEGELSLAATCQPRIEPECVFGLRATPPARASLDELFACVDWIAPGFEIVQSHMKDWKFSAADTVADGGLHGRLLVGRRIPAAALPAGAAALEAQLAAARVTLLRDGERIEEGHRQQRARWAPACAGALPLCTADYPGAADLQPGDVVTTGTWTDAWPARARPGAPSSVRRWPSLSVHFI